MGCKNCTPDENARINLNDYTSENKIVAPVMELIKKSDNKQEDSNLDIPIELKYLEIKNIFLGLISEYNFYNKNRKEIRKKGYSKKDFAHPSLYAFFDEKNGYFIDYQPSKTKASNVKYIYKGQESGLRYGKKTFKEFVEYNNICIISLKFHSHKNFYDFFKECCSNDKSWTEKNFSYENNNCCDFIIKALEILGANLKTGNIENDVLIFNEDLKNNLQEEGKTKEDIMPTKLLNYFRGDQNETDVSV